MKPTRRQFLRGAKDLAVTASPAGRVLNKAGSLLTNPFTRKVGVYLTDPKSLARRIDDFSGYPKPNVHDPHLSYGSTNPAIHNVTYYDPKIGGLTAPHPKPIGEWQEKIGEIEVPNFEINFKTGKRRGDINAPSDLDIQAYQEGINQGLDENRIGNIKSLLGKGRKLHSLYQEAQRVKSLYDTIEGKPKQIDEKPEKPKKTPVQKRIEHSTKQRTALAQKPFSGIPWGDVIRVGISRLSGVGAGLELASYISPGGSTGDATLENWYKKNARKPPIKSSGPR